MKQPPNLECVSIVVPVTDLAHAVQTVANLADIRGQLRVEHLEVVVNVAPGTSEFLGRLSGLADQLEALAK